MLRALEAWHLLSLDAPTVAASWTCFIAQSCGIALPWTAPAAMFLAVWILYAADRLLDARGPATSSELEARHLFHHRHSRAFRIGIALAATALAALLPHLLPEALRLYALLGTLLTAWFLLIHTRLAETRRLPKELAVAVFFPAAVFIPTVARRPDLRATLLVPALLFGAVCALNCLYVYAWEHPADRDSAHWTTHFATRHLTAIASCTLALAAVLCVTHASIAPWFAPSWRIAAAYALSAAMLMALDRLHGKVSALSLRASADLALLTPLLFAFSARGIA